MERAAWGDPPLHLHPKLGCGLEGKKTGLSQVGQDAVTSVRGEQPVPNPEPSGVVLWLEKLRLGK